MKRLRGFESERPVEKIKRPALPQMTQLQQLRIRCFLDSFAAWKSNPEIILKRDIVHFQVNRCDDVFSEKIEGAGSGFESDYVYFQSTAPVMRNSVCV